jgi:hypothetical protein
MIGNPTEAQLAALGITGVTSANLGTVQAALATPVDAIQLNTLAGVQSVVNNAIYATGAIQEAAENNTATPTTPSVAQYLAAGVIGVDANNLAAINDALNDPDVTGAQADTTAKVQAIVDGFNAILANADGTANNASNPTLANYAAIGVNGVDSAVKVSLLGDVIDTLAPGSVSQVAQVQTLADAVLAVMTAAATGVTSALSKAQLEALGITGVTDDNLSAVLAAIAASSDDGRAVDTLGELQSVITAAVSAQASAIQKIAAYAETGTTAPTHSDYAAAGVAGVTPSNLSAINDAINNQKGPDATLGNANDKEAADTTAKVQAIVNAYNTILIKR